MSVAQATSTRNPDPPQWLFVSQPLLAERPCDGYRTTLNVSLPVELGNFIAAKIASGRYASASEVVRAGLRLLEASEAFAVANRASEAASVPDGSAPPDIDPQRRTMTESLQASRTQRRAPTWSTSLRRGLAGLTMPACR